MLGGKRASQRDFARPHHAPAVVRSVSRAVSQLVSERFGPRGEPGRAAQAMTPLARAREPSFAYRPGAGDPWLGTCVGRPRCISLAAFAPCLLGIGRHRQRRSNGWLELILG